MNEQEMRDLFREMREEPAPADSLARVRAAVEERIGKRSWTAGWKIAAALAMAGFLVGAFLFLRLGKPVPVQQVSAPQIAQVLPPVESPARPEIPPRPAVMPKRVRPRTVVESVPVSIRIETPDPDVVILLVN